jgi:hypothetical protein
MEDRFAHDAFFVDQLIRPLANLYRISTLGLDGSSAGEPLAFVRQKKLAIKEDIRFFADESEQDELFRLKARQVIEIRGRFDVLTPDGGRIGTLEKVFGASLLRSTWRILDAHEAEVAMAQEKSVPLALLRRVIDLVPYGEFVPILFQLRSSWMERRSASCAAPWASATATSSGCPATPTAASTAGRPSPSRSRSTPFSRGSRRRRRRDA